MKHFVYVFIIDTQKIMYAGLNEFKNLEDNKHRTACYISNGKKLHI